MRSGICRRRSSSTRAAASPTTTDWRLGVGPRHERHGAPDYAWGTWEENDFGTDEFLLWCELTRTEPYLCVNHGSGDLALAAAWVEYCNGGTDTEWGARRARNGREAPWGVRLWAVGNEVYGSWERGAADAETYGANVRRFAAAMKDVDPGIEIVAQGDLGEYSEQLLWAAGDAFDYLSVHHYAGHADAPFADPEEYVAAGRAFEDRLTRLVAAIRATPDAGHVRLALDEWGWAYGNDPAGIAFTASVLAACVRLAPYVAVGGHCCVVNPGAVVERTGERVTRTRLYDVFQLFDRAHRDEALHAECDDPALGVCAFADPTGAASCW
jgi:alpha-N-arabinofuranosidase